MSPQLWAVWVPLTSAGPVRAFHLNYAFLPSAGARSTLPSCAFARPEQADSWLVVLEGLCLECGVGHTRVVRVLRFIP